jgi:hypothetical protein
MRRIALFAMLVAGCTKSVNQCETDADCKNPAYPFCDVNGEFAPSDGEKNICTIVPPDCPVERCGCTPGATSCGSDTLTVCNADGMSQTMTTCEVGCEADATACQTFVPSNGLGPSLAGAATLPSLVIPDGAKIDTDTGVVTASDGTVVHDGSVSSLVTFGSISIRVFAAPTLTLQSVKVTGTNPIAFVAATTIELDGLVDVSADGSNAGPGAAPPTSSANASTLMIVECNICAAQGAGGGGNAIAGGIGGGGLVVAGSGAGSGGSPETGFELVGGGSGGTMIGEPSPNPDVYYVGGAGGGAIQLVAGSKITLAGIVNAGGGGGQSGFAGGGGAGGLVIVETPVLSIGATGGIAANGGGGAGDTYNGGDGTPDDVAAPGGGSAGDSVEYFGGNGGIATSTVTDLAAGEDLPKSGGGPYGGGGGSVGRARIATYDGTFTQDPSATMSVALTMGMLTTQ